MPPKTTGRRLALMLIVNAMDRKTKQALDPINLLLMGSCFYFRKTTKGAPNESVCFYFWQKRNGCGLVVLPYL